jgi:hypothetical protein
VLDRELLAHGGRLTSVKTDGPPDVPPDVASVLHQLLDAAQAAERPLDSEEFRATVETAQTVTRNKLPESDLRAQLLHGTEQVLATAERNPPVAEELLRVMQQRLVEATGETDVLESGADGDRDGDRDEDYDGDADDRDDSVE